MKTRGLLAYFALLVLLFGVLPSLLPDHWLPFWVKMNTPKGLDSYEKSAPMEALACFKELGLQSYSLDSSVWQHTKMAQTIVVDAWPIRVDPGASVRVLLNSELRNCPNRNVLCQKEGVTLAVCSR